MKLIPSQLTEKAKNIINQSNLPDTYFMCVAKDVLEELCELFPQTAENIKKKSLDRRQRFMQQKRLVAKKNKMKGNDESQDEINSKSQNDIEDSQAGLRDFETDEQNEDSDDQKEDMKNYLKKLNKKIDTLVDALKEAET